MLRVCDLSIPEPGEARLAPSRQEHTPYLDILVGRNAVIGPPRAPGGMVVFLETFVMELKVSGDISKGWIMQTEKEVWQILRQVMDPEIPVVSIVDMGIVRDVALEEDTVRVRMTPTFSGCPALEVIQRLVEEQLSQAGLKPEVIWIDYPAWSSDWITPQARQKMTSIGLAPPPRHNGLIELALLESGPLSLLRLGEHNPKEQLWSRPYAVRSISAITVINLSSGLNRYES